MKKALPWVLISLGIFTILYALILKNDSFFYVSLWGVSALIAGTALLASNNRPRAVLPAFGCLLLLIGLALLLLLEYDIRFGMVRTGEGVGVTFLLNVFRLDNDMFHDADIAFARRNALLYLGENLVLAALLFTAFFRRKSKTA